MSKHIKRIFLIINYILLFDSGFLFLTNNIYFQLIFVPKFFYCAFWYFFVLYHFPKNRKTIYVTIVLLGISICACYALINDNFSIFIEGYLNKHVKDFTEIFYIKFTYVMF